MRRNQLFLNKYIATLFLVVFWALLSIASNQLVVQKRHNRFDFYPRWVGSRAILEGRTPYSDEVTENIQMGMFGRRLGPEEDQQRFAYMPLIAFQLLPVWLLPFPLAVSLWMGLQMVLLLSLPIVVWNILDWHPSLPLFAGLLLCSIILFRYPINAYLIGQFIPFCLASLVLAWWGISIRSHSLAAFGLIFSLVRPEVVIIPAIFLIIVSWDVFRFRVIKRLSLWLAVIWAIAWAMIGFWEVDYLEGIFSYSKYSTLIWPPSLINSSIISAILILVIFAWAAWMILNVAKYPLTEKVGWLLSISIIFSLLTLPQTGNYTLILGLLVVWFVVGLPGQRATYGLIISAVLSLPWVFHLLPQALSSLEHLAVPLSLACVLTLKYHFRPSSSPVNSTWNLADA